MGDETPGPMAMTFGTLGDLVNIINRSSFGTDRFKGFRSVKGRKRPFSILKSITLFNALPGLLRDVPIYVVWRKEVPFRVSSMTDPSWEYT